MKTSWYTTLLKHCMTLGPIGYMVGGGTWASLITYGYIYYSYYYWHAYWWLIIPMLLLIGFEALEYVLPLYQHPDPSEIVFDEVIGSCIALIGVSSGYYMVLSFIIFRILDIYKPWGIFSVQRLPGPLGVIADDVLAGLYAAGICWSVAHLL